MKTGDLIEILMTYNKEDEIEIEVYETISGKYIDTTADIVFEDGLVPALRVDVEAEKFKPYINNIG